MGLFGNVSPQSILSPQNVLAMSPLGLGGAALAKAPFVKNLVTNPAKALTVQNSTQGATPDITQTNFQPSMAAALQQLAASQNAIGNTATSLNGLARNQTTAAQGYKPLLANQYAVANNLNDLAGNQAGLAGQASGYAGNIAGLSAQDAQILAQQQALEGQQQGLYGQQNSLAQQLLAQSQGQGPNPAQQQYQQNINANTAAAAGTIASQRGISPALAAELVAQQQGSANQNAAGQAAVLQAQQQLAAQGALQNQQAAMGANLTNQGQTLNSQLGTVAGQGALYGQAGNALGQASNIYGQAGNQYGTQGNVLNQAGNTLNSQVGAYGQAANTLGEAGNLYGNQGTLANQNYGANVSGQSNQNTAINVGSLGAQGITANAANQNAAQTETTQSGLLNALGGGLAKFSPTSSAPAAAAPAGNLTAGGAADVAGPAAIMAAAHGGEIPDAHALAKVLPLAMALMKMGGPVPGKAKVKGDSSKNDTVPTMLSPGEIVLPRSITQAPDSANKAAEFVKKLQMKKAGYGDVVRARKQREGMRKSA